MLYQEDTMPELNWDQTDFIECLEVLPQTNEYGTEQIFQLDREGLSLKVSVWPLESVVYLDLHRVNHEARIIGFALFVRGRVEHVKERSFEYLRFHDALPAPSRFSYMDFSEDVHSTARSPYGLTVRLRTKPDIEIEFERTLA
jgi:hypothetical protein